MSRSRQQAALRGELRGDLPDAVRTLLIELRALKETSGYDLRTLERKTHSSRSSWGRWLSGETWIPLASVNALASLCGADRRRLEILWELADQARRSAPAEPPPAEVTSAEVPSAEVTSAEVTSEQAAPVAGGTDRTSRAGETPRRAGRRGLMLVAIIACTAVAGGVGVLLGSSLRSGTGDRAPAPAAPNGPSILRAPAAGPTRPAAPVKATTRSEVIARARSWNPRSDARIPYSQSGMYDGYRTDGSGYASMALGLPRPGPNSTGLAWGTYSRRIPMARLRPGDLIINATGDSNRRRVVIFERWADPARKSYWAYQQRRGYGTDRLVLRDGLTKDSNSYAYRPRNIRDEPVG